jgi:hypothetical protein
VAIKVLPAFASQDPDRLRRFEQEAQAAAALNHPNILAVHQFGTFEGAPYLVSELLDGDTLRQLLERGPLPVRKAIDYGVQIAHGLAASHDKGIVHRDLKPENLFVTKDGRIKILDFGLAKLMQRQPEPDGIGPTQTHGTDPGVVMGTVGYMSPEQVRGKTGRPSSRHLRLRRDLVRSAVGQTGIPTVHVGGDDDRHPERRPAGDCTDCADHPSGAAAGPAHCLEKNPEQRFHSASDLAFALEALSDSGASSIVANTRGSRSRWVWLAAAGAVAVLAALFTVWWRIPPAVPVVESITQLTDDGEVKYTAVSSDGSRIYFTELAANNNGRIKQVSATGGATAAVETNLANASVAAVTHDGSGLLALGNGNNDIGYELWMIPLPAGEPRRVGSFLALSAKMA